MEKLDLSSNALTSEHVAVLKDLQNLKTLLVPGNKISNLKTAFNSGGFANLGENSAFNHQQISLDTTKRLFKNPLKDYNGNVIPVTETTNVKNVDANGNPKQDGGYIKILNLDGTGNVEINWSQLIRQYGNKEFAGTITLNYNFPEFESITESIENDTKIFAKTDDKIKVSLNLKQPATWKAGNTLEYCIGDDTSCAPSNGNYQNIGAFTKADTPEKTRNKTITVPAGKNGHLYYRNIAFQNKDGENMKNNPTDSNKNYAVKTILVDTKAPTCGTPTHNPTTPTNGNVTVTFVPQDDGSGLAASTQTSCTISKNNESCEFKIFDKAGNEAICKSGVVTNIDTEKPVITGEQTKTFEVGSDDAKNFDPKSGIQTEAGANLTCAENPSYDATKTGTYTVKCKAKDAAGNDSDEFVRTITINPIDKTPLNNKISATENLLQTDKKIVNDANKTALRNKLQDAKTKAQDQNLTKKQRDDLIAEITDLVNKLTRDTQAPDLNLNDITVNEDVAITPIDLKQATNNDDIKQFVVNVRLPANATPDFSLDNATKTIVGMPKQPGIYEVTVTAEDQYENKTTKTFKITVKDTTKPEITLNGSPTITLVKGQPYNEPGATCTDNYDATCNVVTTGGPVDSNTLGKTIITYTATDAAGNTSTKTREVTIVSGNTPVITLVGNSPVNVELGDTYTDGGATANDAEDGDITAKIKKTGTVDTSRVGTYEISYDVTDSSGNKAPTVKRQIIVKDTKKPTISPVANTEVDEKNPITPIDIVVTDNDSQLTVSFVTTDANGNVTNGLPPDLTYDPITKKITGTPKNVGVYQIVIHASDSSGNKTDAKNFTLTVKDKTAPKIDPIADKTLPPNQPITPINITTDDSTDTINVEPTTLPPGLTFNSATNQITGTPTTPGTYTVKIKAKDPAGNESEQEFKITITSPSNNNGGNNGNNNSNNNTTKPTAGPGGGGFSIPTNPNNSNNNQNNNSNNTNNPNNQNNTNIQKPIITPEGTLSTQHGVTPNNQTTPSGQKIYNLSGRITDYICPAIVQAYPYNELVVQDISNSSFQDDISALMMFRGMEKDEMNLGQTYEEYKKYGVVNNVTQFQPSRNVTRAEFVKMLVRSLSCRYTYLGKDTPFPDVDKNMWYAEYIKFAVENKWINGYKDGTFRPNAPITRDEAAKILARAIQLDTSNTKSANSSFSDVPNTSEFIPYIETLKFHGVMKGRNSNTFAPKEFIPRTETSRMIYRTFFGGKN